MKKMNKNLPFITLLIIASSVLSLLVLRTVSYKTLPLYYSYSDVQLTDLKEFESQAKMSQTQVFEANNKVFDLVKREKLPPTQASRIYAYLASAHFDAVRIGLHLYGKTPGDLSVVSAKIICEFFPKEQMCSDESTDAYSNALADLILQKVQERKNQDSIQSIVPKPLKGDNYWAGINPVTPDAASWKTWFLSSGNFYRADAPPEYGSKEDLDQLKQVKDALKNVSDEQKDAVAYWAGGAGTVTPGGIWLGLFDEQAKKENLSLQKLVESRFVLAGTIADAFIACWDTKFTYWTKRPNMRDSSIRTIIPTPNFPSYTSGHSTVSAAAALILSQYFPEGNWNQMAQEAKDSRLWAGIHFPVDNEVGFELGKNVGENALEVVSKNLQINY